MRKLIKPLMYIFFHNMSEATESLDLLDWVNSNNSLGKILSFKDHKLKDGSLILNLLNSLQ